VVEDNRADVFLIRESIETAHIDADLHVVQDGDKAIRFFEQADRDAAAPCPALVILDINLPKRPGREVLQQMRLSPRCAQAAVLVVTSSDSERDRDEMRSFGVKGYFRKPSSYDGFMKLGDVVKELLDAPPGNE
jgi:chemotaxis family two-component system response regulator Rcp1